MLSMDVVARCRSRVTWVRNGYLPVKPSANNGADLYLGVKHTAQGSHASVPAACAFKSLGLVPLLSFESLSAAVRAVRAITAPYWIFGG